MRTPIILAAGLTALAFVATVAPAAAIDTIDCSQVRNAAERTICSIQRLQILDAKVTEAYADIMLNNHIKASVKAALRDSQYVFLQRRDRCGRDQDCLVEVMEQRASRITFYR